MELEGKTLKNSMKTSEVIGINNTLRHDEKSKYVQSFIMQLFNKLNINKEISYVVDRFEENYAVCENRETKEMKNINIYELPKDIKEGDVLRYTNGEYMLDKELQQSIEERIREKTKNIFEED